MATLRFLAPALLAFSNMGSANVSPTPSDLSRRQSVVFALDVELDLIFPRNDTYQPVEWFPFVFAIQNYVTARPHDIDFDWYLSVEGEKPLPGGGDWGSVILGTGGKDVDRIFVAFSLRPNATVRGGHPDLSWKIIWDFGFVTNSSVDEGGIIYAPNRTTTGSMWFTTSMEGKVPDLSDVVDECPIFGQGARVVDSAINVGNQCPVLAEVFDKPEPSPCEVGVNITLPTVVNGYRDKLIAGCGFRALAGSAKVGELWGQQHQLQECRPACTNERLRGAADDLHDVYGSSCGCEVYSSLRRTAL